MQKQFWCQIYIIFCCLTLVSYFKPCMYKKRGKIQQKQGQHPSEKLVNTNQSNAITGTAKQTGRVSYLIVAQLTLESSQQNIYLYGIKL